MKLISSFTIFLIVAISGIKAAALQDEKTVSNDKAAALPDLAPAFKDEPADLTDETADLTDEPATSPDETADLPDEVSASKDETADLLEKTSALEYETDVNTNDLEEVPKEAQEENDADADPRRRRRRVKIRYANYYDKPLNFKCPRGRALTFIGSIHSNHREDRRFALACFTPRISFTRHFTTGYLNKFDKPFSYTCPRLYVVTGLYSRHSNHNEDRVWKVKCSRLRTQNRHNKRSFWTRYTRWDARWLIKAPRRHFITGMRSFHSNSKEDRRYSFQISKFTRSSGDESDETNNENEA